MLLISVLNYCRLIQNQRFDLLRNFFLKLIYGYAKN